MAAGVSYQNVEVDLVPPSGRQCDVDAWKRSRKDASIAPWVLGFRHVALFDVRPDDIKQALDQGELRATGRAGQP